MLSNLNIKNFIIIESLDLEFKPGLTVITGETGAGKSIIIDAIELALGSRSDTAMIGKFSDRCDISLTFSIDQLENVKQWLNNHEFQNEEDCIIRRVITQDGRSKAFINGHPCTLQQIKDLAQLLISIHGQHQHQALHKRQHHRELLDDYAQNKNLVEETNKIYMEWNTLNHKIQDIKNQNQDNSAQLELLHYQVEELNELNLCEGEYLLLDQEHKQLAHAESQITECNLALEKLNDHEEINVISLLNAAQQHIQSLAVKSEAIFSVNELLNHSIMHTEEAISEIRHILETSEINPERLNDLDIRIQKIINLSRKHRCTPENLTQIHHKLKNQLDELQNKDTNLEKLQNKLLELNQHYFTVAKELKKRRITAAKKLSSNITKIMQELSLAGSQLEINITDHDDNIPHQHGTENVEFYVRTNAGMPLQPLNKVASGGEISRIALAIYVITAQQMTTHTMIFDEVDVGIGGSTADIVGKLLKQLGSNAQVLSITHLPQVAAHGHQHLRVHKIQQQNATHTTISELQDAERVNEIARMLGGTKITDKTIAHAQELVLSD